MIRKILTSPFNALRWLWRDVLTVERLTKIKEIAGIATLIIVVLLAFNLSKVQQSNRELAITNRQVLDLIKEQTSPAAQEKQNKQINAILIAVDCNTRRGLQEALDSLVVLGITKAQSVDIVSARCAAVKPPG